MSNRAPLAVAGVVVLAALVAGGIAGAHAWAKSQQNTLESQLASGYDAHPLTSPFVLVSKNWEPQTGEFSTSGSWKYVYSAPLAGLQAATAAKADLAAADGYQVIATDPDVVTPSMAWLYRDLITGDDFVTVHIQPSSGATYQKGPVSVIVTLSDLSGE